MIQQAVEHNIVQIIGQWNVRMRVRQSLMWLPRGLSAGLGAAILAAMLARYQPILLQDQVLVIGLSAMVAGGLVAVAAVWLWPRPALADARRYDALFDLKERLSTALELAGGRLARVHGPIAALQVDDAVQQARRVDYRARLPLTLRGRDWAIAGALLVLFLLLWWLPNPQSDAVAAQQALQQAIESAVSDLRSLREEALSDSSLTEEEREALLQTLDETIEKLEQPGVSREEAVATLSEAGQKLRDIAEDTAESERRMGELREAGQAFNEEPAQEMGQAMQQGNLERAAASARDLANRLGALSQEQREALAQQLEQAAEAIEGTNPEMARQMREAAEALRQGDLERAQEALQTLAEQLQQQGQQQQQAEQAQQSMQGMAQRVQQSQQRIAQQGQPQSQQGQQGQQGQQSQQGQQPQGQPGEQGQQSNAQGSPQGGQPGQGAQGQPQMLGEGDQPGEGAVMGFAESEGRQDNASMGEVQGQESGQRSAGQGEAGFGEGARAADAGGGPIENDNRPGGAGLRQYEAVLAPSRIGGEGEAEMNLPIAPENLEDLPYRPGEYTEPESGQSLVPYNEVFGDYANAVDEALESGRIPLGLRGVIKEYFTSLEP